MRIFNICSRRSILWKEKRWYENALLSSIVRTVRTICPPSATTRLMFHWSGNLSGFLKTTILPVIGVGGFLSSPIEPLELQYSLSYASTRSRSMAHSMLSFGLSSSITSSPSIVLGRVHRCQNPSDLRTTRMSPQKSVGSIEDPRTLQIEKKLSWAQTARGKTAIIVPHEAKNEGIVLVLLFISRREKFILKWPILWLVVLYLVLVWL